MLRRALAQLASSRIEVMLFGALGAQPLFNPDHDAALPVSRVSFQRAAVEAHALLIASPEYAHGVSGTIKNALATALLAPCDASAGRGGSGARESHGR